VWWAEVDNLDEIVCQTVYSTSSSPRRVAIIIVVAIIAADNAIQYAGIHKSYFLSTTKETRHSFRALKPLQT